MRTLKTLDTCYTISFACIQVDDITGTRELPALCFAPGRVVPP
jgi:hypothetical protein